MRRVVLLIAAALSSPAAANTTGCGENAFTFAELVEARPGERHKGAIVSVPDSLCADLVEDRKPGIGVLNLYRGPRQRCRAGAADAFRRASSAKFAPEMAGGPRRDKPHNCK